MKSLRDQRVVALERSLEIVLAPFNLSAPTLSLTKIQHGNLFHIETL